ncbi:MAG: hypothetical protein WC975_08790 [Phycisphaerae bacterium]
MAEPKTVEEHRIYLYDIVKLKLFFLHRWLGEHPEETFSNVLRNRVDIFRKTEVYPGLRVSALTETLCFDIPQWLEMENAAARIYSETKDDEAAFEKSAFDVFKPSLDARCKRDYLDSSVVYQCGCFRHDLKILHPEINAMEFHITNSKSPESFLDYPDYVKECFMQLLDIAEKDFGATNIRTKTWLNSLPRWLEYFPKEWLDRMSEEDVSVLWHLGFWGQFITARGTFNHKYGRMLRESGRLPFYPRFAYCSISAMRAKLDASLQIKG